MTSPVFKITSSLLSIDKNSTEPVYLQIANQLMTLIREGRLQAGRRLPGTRQLADLMNVHRKTVVQAYEELLMQGWLESRTGSGTYVARQLPDLKPQQLVQNNDVPNPVKTAGFSFDPLPHLNVAVILSNHKYHLDDGFPDARLAPVEELARAYRAQLLTGNPYMRLGYSDTRGSVLLRQVLSSYLNDTRGLTTTPENILITRGTIMGLHLACTALLKPGDLVVTGEMNYHGANMNVKQAGAQLLKIPVDENGMVVDELETICRKQPVRMVYVTSHHNYPTTVAMSAERRVDMLQLAAQYGFIVFEDDYDYDFHYLGKPLFPLASADRAGMVLYCGSFSKTISPAFRVGYLVGSENVIGYLAQLRRIIDRQGDVVLENAIAVLMQSGIIQRHLRKALRTYKQRRDLFCQLLCNELGNYVQFKAPDGGMAVWTQFNKSIDLPWLAQEALKQELYFSNGSLHNSPTKNVNATRLGFASSTPEELERSVGIIAGLLKR
jgi:Transcriptional regulators containing a DNA-binding HTH domain and an aminotransferase domain (MocR family) and their eukaryotic orthologs